MLVGLHSDAHSSMRMGWFRSVHARSTSSQEVRALLVARKQVQSKLIDVELSIRGILRGIGLKLGHVSRNNFSARIKELVAGQASGGRYRRSRASCDATPPRGAADWSIGRLAQWHAERAARRPKKAKLALNAALRTYVQERMAGTVVPSGVPVPGPESWRNH